MVQQRYSVVFPLPRKPVRMEPGAFPSVRERLCLSWRYRPGFRISLLGVTGIVITIWAEASYLDCDVIDREAERSGLLSQIRVQAAAFKP